MTALPASSIVKDKTAMKVMYSLTSYILVCATAVNTSANFTTRDFDGVFMGGLYRYVS